MLALEQHSNLSEIALAIQLIVHILLLCLITYIIFRNGVVTYNHIMELREKLDKMLKTKGLIAEEKGISCSNVIDVIISCIICKFILRS